MVSFLKNIRFRHIYMVWFSLLVLVMLFVSSPDVGLIDALPMGAGFIATVVLMLRAVLYVAILHFSRKALFDYLDLELLYDRARHDPVGAGLAMIAVSIAMISIAILIRAAVG